MIDLDAHIARVHGWVQAVRVVNGYRTDLGAAVDTERRGGNGDDSQTLCGVFLAGLEPLKTTPLRRDWQLDVAVEARIPVRSTTAELQMRAALEDLVRAIPTKVTDPDNNLATLELAGTDIARQPDGVPYIVVSVTLRATCYEFIPQPA